MDLALIFWIAHVPAVTGWLALLILPYDARAITFARGAAVVVALGYLLIFLWSGSAGAVLARDYSFHGIGTFFADPRLLLLGWVHYLAFDLWVGTWEAQEGARTGMSRLLIVPALLLTFMLGPIGLLLFLLLRPRSPRPLSA
jgi:hypothetical protein